MARILGPGAAGDIDHPDNATAATPSAPATPTTPTTTPPAGGGS